MHVRRVIILGSTGSIGTQAVEAISHVNALARRAESPVAFEVVGLAAGANARLLAEQSRRLGCTLVALAKDDEPLGDLPSGSRVLRGARAAEQLVREAPACDLVVSAIVGVAGLEATIAAIDRGADVALANKETLVAAGALVVPRCTSRNSRASLLPVDSEHAALWQCLRGQDASAARGAPAPPMAPPPELRRAILTASGGPFRTWTADRIRAATPQQALSHPTWSMGAKVTIDSASLMNKALELIEAHWLFGLGADQLDVLVHPQSIVHAIAEFADGSCVAQLAPPDMRLPIQRALTHPHTLDGVARKMDFAALRTLEFAPPDLVRFPALALAHRVIELGGTSGAIVNAANEEAVDAFLRGAMGFGAIAEVVQETLSLETVRSLATLHDLREADGAARDRARSLLARQGAQLGAALGPDA